MAIVSSSTVYLKGKVYWAKILGQPHPGFGGEGKLWSFELEPDKESLAVLKEHKLTDRLKDGRDKGRGKFITIRKRAESKEGVPNKPIRVWDKKNNEWDKNALIGNGSLVNVRLDIVDYGPTKKKGVYPVAVRVLEHVEYQPSDFGAIDDGFTDEEEEEGNNNNIGPKSVDFDDDIPF